MDRKEKILEGIGSAYTTAFGSDSDKQAFSVMRDWNRLKSDMYEGRVIPEFGIPDSDRFCRSGAAITIGQKAAKLPKIEGDALIASALDYSELREKADSFRKGKANNTDKDADIKIFKEALEVGKNNPNTDTYALLAELDMNTATFKKGYNNGYANLIKNHYPPDGKQHSPVCSLEEGIAINRLVKGNFEQKSNGQKIFRNYAEIQPFLNKAKELQAQDSSLALGNAVALVEKDWQLCTELNKNRETVDRNHTAEKMKRDRALAEAQIKAEREKRVAQGQRAAQAAKRFDAGKIPDAKTPKKEKVQVPMAPKTSSVKLPTPAWQQKAKSGR